MGATVREPVVDSTANGVRPWRLTPAFVVTAGLVVLSVLWFAVGLVRPTPSLVGWLPLTGSVPIAVVAAWRAAGPGTRTFWRYAAVGMALIGLGAAFNAWDNMFGAHRNQHVSGLTAAVYLSGLLVMIVGLLRIPGARRAGGEWARFGLDIATVIMTALTFTWHVALPRWEHWFGGGAGDVWSVFTLVVGGFICVVAFVKVAFTGTGPIDRRSLHLLAATGAVGAGGGSLAPLLASRPWLNTAHLILPVTCLMLCVATDRQVRVGPAATGGRRPSNRRPSVMPYAAVAATAGLLMVCAVGPSRDIAAVAAGSVCVTVLVAVRQLLALRDNATLLRQLDARLHDLDQVQRRLAHQATHDTLTGLANRGVLHDAAARTDGPVTVLLLDLDGFKEVNDSFGHHAGDQLLVHVADRLRSAVRADDDLVVRLGGDEFAVLLRHADGDNPGEVTAARITAEFERPFLIDGVTLDIEASIGIATAAAGEDLETVLQHADTAMYAAKEHRLGATRYNPVQAHETAARLTLLGDLRRALDTGDSIELHYQPKLSVGTGELVGAEALARWQHPVRGQVPPCEFIPVLEGTSLIHRFTAHVLDLALTQARTWLDAGHRIPVAVNVSTRSLLDTAFPDVVRDALARTEVPGDLLCIEITENTVMHDPAHAIDVLRRIRALGVRTAIDDFGTGYSSMAYLKILPVDELKVDRTFVRDMATDHGNHVLVESAVDLGHNLGLAVVAEGVEDLPTVQALRKLGCDVAQGFHYAKPLPAHEFLLYATNSDPVPTP
jgi:diguanylate cyclase (GGDEF)-like protein